MEGFTIQENIQFCRIARGSLSETKDHLFVALDSGFINQKLFDELITSYEPTLKLLNGYINFLQKQKSAVKK
ncbi:MAG: four helix bundle protein [Arenicella sp.]|jgi:four helix bundle protein